MTISVIKSDAGDKMSVLDGKQSPTSIPQNLINPHGNEGFLFQPAVRPDELTFQFDPTLVSAVGRPRTQGDVTKTVDRFRAPGGRIIRMLAYTSVTNNNPHEAIQFEPGCATTPEAYDPFARLMAQAGYVVAMTMPESHDHTTDALERRADICAAFGEYLLSTRAASVNLLGYSMGNHIASEGGLRLAEVLPLDPETKQPQGLRSMISLAGFGNEADVSALDWLGRVGGFLSRDVPSAAWHNPRSMGNVLLHALPHRKRLIDEGISLLATGAEANANHDLLTARGVPCRTIVTRHDRLIHTDPELVHIDAIVPVDSHLPPITHPQETAAVVLPVIRSVTRTSGHLSLLSPPA